MTRPPACVVLNLSRANSFPENIEAYALYIGAMQLSNEPAESSLREAVDLFNRAVSEDPEFACAYAGLSQAWGWLAELRRDKIEVHRFEGEAEIQAALGNLDETFEALWRQAETHAWNMWIRYLHVFEELRMDPTSEGGGGIPEFPYQFLGVAAFTVLIAASYLLVRRRGTA